MLSSFRFAGIITMIVAVCGVAKAQELAPAGSGVSVYKVDVDNNLAHTVKYYVTGGSARLKALVRRVEWAENELSVIEQLQMFKLDTVVNERRVAGFRTAQLTNPYYPPGVVPYPVAPVTGGVGASPLQRSLGRQLAAEATPEAAMQMIGFMEQVQTELDAELKALTPTEQKAAQDSVDALRKRVEALPHSDAPPPRPLPALPQLPPVVPQLPQGLLPAPVPAAARGAVEVYWGNKWWPAEVVQVNGGLTRIHYTGWDSSWDEWVPANRIRPACTVSAPPPVSMPPAPAAFQQSTAIQDQDRMIQQILQMQQQIARQQPQLAGRLR
jgi:hypothetical protein